MKAQIKALRDQETALQEELALIADAAVDYAKREGITNITGSNCILKVIEETVLSFPKSGEEGRDEMEKCIKKAEIWEEVSGLNLARLNKLIENDEIDEKTRKRLMKFAEEAIEVSVRLTKKRLEAE
jgi:undecaprenyl pyrophosphate synthase